MTRHVSIVELMVEPLDRDGLVLQRRHGLRFWCFLWEVAEELGFHLRAEPAQQKLAAREATDDEDSSRELITSPERMVTEPITTGPIVPGKEHYCGVKCARELPTRT